MAENIMSDATRNTLSEFYATVVRTMTEFFQLPEAGRNSKRKKKGHPSQRKDWIDVLGTLHEIQSELLTDKNELGCDVSQVAVSATIWFAEMCTLIQRYNHNIQSEAAHQTGLVYVPGKESLKDMMRDDLNNRPR